MTYEGVPRSIKGHALARGTDRWACICGTTIKDPSAGRALARRVYRNHLFNVWFNAQHATPT